MGLPRRRVMARGEKKYKTFSQILSERKKPTFSGLSLAFASLLPSLWPINAILYLEWRKKFSWSQWKALLLQLGDILQVSSQAIGVTAPAPPRLSGLLQRRRKPGKQHSTSGLASPGAFWPPPIPGPNEVGGDFQVSMFRIWT